MNKQVVDPGVCSVVEEMSVSWMKKGEERKKEANQENNKFFQKMRKDLSNVISSASEPHPDSMVNHGEVIKFSKSNRPFAIFPYQASKQQDHLRKKHDYAFQEIFSQI